MKELIPEIVRGLLAFLGGGLLERKRKKADLKNAETNAILSMQNAYDHFVNDSKQRYDDLKKEVERLKSELQRVEQYWKNKYQSLKKEFEEYRKRHE